MLSLASSGLRAGEEKGTKVLKIVCVGGHPGDPEAGPGGTLARFAAAGHRVSNLYFNRGEAGVDGKTSSEAAEIRTAEATAACTILGAKPIFFGQIDGAGVVNNDWVARMEELLASEKPDIVFTHWPIDSHKDHQCASLLTIQAWMRAKVKFDLYFFEVGSGVETMTFHLSGSTFSSHPLSRSGYVDVDTTDAGCPSLAEGRPGSAGLTGARDGYSLAA